MPHGQPDFGMYASKQTVFGMADMAELAARLGSIVRYDRRGDVVWLEDFSGDMTNWTSEVSDGGSVAVVAEESLDSGVSCKLITPDGIGTLALIYRHSPLPVNSRIGCEVAFLPDSNGEDLWLEMVLYNGTYRWYGRVVVRMDEKIITYYASDQSTQTLATGVSLRLDSKCWHYMKLVVDLETNEYVRFLLDNVEYSMADLGVPREANVLLPMMFTRFLHASALPAVDIPVYITNIILTQNEP